MNSAFVLKKKKLIRILLCGTVITIALMYFSNVRKIDGASSFYKALLLTLIFVCIENAIKENSIINPYLAFTLVPLSLFLYDVNVSTYYLVKLTSSTYIFSIYNMIMLMFGLMLGKHLRYKFNSRTWGKFVEADPQKDSRNAYQLLAIGIIPYVLTSIIGFDSFISLNMNALKALFGTMPVSSVLSLFCYPGIIFAIRSKNKRTIAFAGFCFLLSVIINFSKTAVVLWSVIIVLIIYKRTRNKPKKKVAFVFALIVAAVIIYESFDIYNNIRFDYNLNDYFSQMDYVGNISSGMFLPYMYITSPWSNVQYLLETIKEHTYGLWIFKPLLGYLQLDNFFLDAYTLTPRFSAFNTYTYMSVFFIDFGVVGSGICSFLLGNFMMYIYRLYRKFEASPLITAAYALNFYAMIMLFFNNHYLQQSYPITIVLIVWLWNKIHKA